MAWLGSSQIIDSTVGGTLLMVMPICEMRCLAVMDVLYVRFDCVTLNVVLPIYISYTSSSKGMGVVGVRVRSVVLLGFGMPQV